ncbi:unnamed protein product [Effrenium voratum]|nr:unnamed protein product [Effrenium voratum]
MEVARHGLRQACGAPGAKHRIGAAVERLRSENVEYQPGQALSVDGVSIFANVNGAIGSFRRDSFAPFGRDLGGLLQQLEPPEPSESSSSRAGLKLRGSEREPEPDAAD